jgi:small conductance mechanosensitive channel
VNVTPLFALVGGASFILAFAMQDTLSNLAAGLMIMINHPFDEGDSVDIAGVAGTVKTVSIVSTTVMTPDNQVIVVPNSKVWGNVIKNSTASETRRVDLTFGVSRGEPIAKVQGVLEETVKAHPLVLASPAPTIQVSELTDGAIKFAVQPWAKLGDLGTVQSDLLRQVKEAFERAEITAA